jgi:hypothetical protein
MEGKNSRDEIGPKLKKSVVISKQSQKVYKRVEKALGKENINNYVNLVLPGFRPSAELRTTGP